MSRLKITADKVKPITVLGVSAGLQNAIFSLANLFIQIGINSFDTVIVEGNAAAANMDSIIYTVFDAVYIAETTFIGQNLGAKNKKRILQSYFCGVGFAFGIGVFLAPFMLIFGRNFLSLFANDPAVIEAGMDRLKIMAVCYGFSAFMDATVAANRGLGKSLAPVVIIFLGSCVFRIVWIYTIFAYFHTVFSLYLVFICSWVITATFEIIYFVKEYKKTVRYFNAPETRPVL